jgi:capsule polysaccharide export protein KpsE/RkpR
MLSDMVGMKTSGALFIKMLQSDTVQDDLINRFDLRRVYGIKTYQSTRAKLSSRTAISEDKKSGVISIDVTDRDPIRAAALAQAYVDELNNMVVSLDTSAAHRERVFLEDRLKVVRQELDVASKAFSEFASKNTAIDIKEQGKAMVQSAAILQGQLIAAESELRGLEQIYAPNNVRVRSLQARVSELQRQLEKMGGSATDDSSGSSSDQMYPSIRQLPLLGVPYYNLFRELTISETVYQVLTKQYEMSRIEEAKEVPSVKVIDVAQPPEKRSGPSRTLIVLAGLLLSTLGVCGWIVGQSRWQAVDESDPGKSLAVEVMATQKQWLIRKWKQVLSRFNGHADLG